MNAPQQRKIVTINEREQRPHEARFARMQMTAQKLLEGPLQRRHWTADLRDRLARELERVAAAEVQRDRKARAK